MLPSDEMVRVACDVYYKTAREMHPGDDFTWNSEAVASALTAALAPYEAPPFVLSEMGRTAHERARLDLLQCRLHNEAITADFDRAIKTLGVAQAAPVAGEWTEADYEAAEQGIVLQMEESFLVKEAARAALDAVAHRLATPADEALEDALERAQETIAVLEAKLVAPLTSEERGEVEDCRHCHSLGIQVSGNKLDALLRITESRFPKPVKPKTAQELLDEAAQYHGGPDEVPEFVYELAKLAGAK